MSKELTTAERGYGSRWQKARIQHLRSHPLCEDCQKRGRVEQATVVDHIKPHRLGWAIESGDPYNLVVARKLFWDRNNWQSLCAACHSGSKQQLEKSGTQRGADANGIPTDPNHHWNTP